MPFTDEELAYLRSQPEQPYERVGMVGPGTYIRVTPTVSWSWNLAGEQAGATWYPARRTVHQPPGTPA
jgi:pyridoxamine 5'-phosphate oxidase family protein